MLFWPLWTVLGLWAHLALVRGEYWERLDLTPLVPASLLASFSFRGSTSKTAYEQQHFQHVPRALGQILQHTHTSELHLRFSSGRWDAESWGQRPHNGGKEGGTGVEIWAYIQAEGEDSAFERWISLNQALAGLFCASMNFIDSTRTTRPVMTFQPMGNYGNHSTQNLHLLHGTLPREVVCTENLTPFLKLLPCKGKAGIGSLLDGHKLFDSTWQSMSIDVQPTCTPDGICNVEMEQNVDMVLDIERSKRPRGDPIPRPLPHEDLVCDRSRPYPGNEFCFPLDLAEPREWSLVSMFGRPLRGKCLASEVDHATAASVCVHARDQLEAVSNIEIVEFRDTTGLKRCITLPSDTPFELTVPKQDAARFSPITLPPLFAERSITGHGQERGGVRTLLTNLSPTESVEFVLFESLPWFMKPFVHTLRARIAGNSSIAQDDLIKDMFYRPGLDRARGSQLELHLVVPPASTVTLSYDFEKAILRYAEYPPDANRGREVAAAVIRLLKVGSSEYPSDQTTPYLRTTSLMLPLPTPDFSMPYNVIILTSTVIALAFGSIFNILIRRFAAADEAEGPGLKDRIQHVLALLVERFKSRSKR